MDNEKYCQSCGMPLASAGDFATNTDGSKNEEYCIYCYKDGAFTADISMEEMIDYCAAHVDEWKIPMSKDEAIAWMKDCFPKLKRWAKA